jgi:acyl carrier protein
MQDIKDKLREVLVTSLRLDISPADVPDHELVSTLGLNSINTIEFLIFVESEFGIEVADEDLTVDLIDDLDRLADYVLKAGGGVAAPEAPAGALVNESK